MSRRNLYRFERSRSQRDGGIGMAMYRLEQRQKRQQAQNRISRRVAKDLTNLGRGILLLGPRRRRRRK
jgi:hypothetical protein